MHLMPIYTFILCSADVNSNWTDSEISMLPTYKKLIAAGLRIWVFRQEFLNSKDGNFYN